MNYEKPILLDGGFGRELEKNNVDISASLWSGNAFYGHLDIIKKIHRDFIEAGADVITSNTYALTNYYLSKANKEKDQIGLLNTAYRLAREAIEESGKKVYLAASIPPLSESYRSDLVDEKKLFKEYYELVKCALENNVDIILGETFSTKAEAKALLEVCRGIKKDLWISFTVNEDGNLRSDELLEEAAYNCLENDAQAVLVNCASVSNILKSIEKFKKLSESGYFIYGAYANKFYEIRKDFVLEDGLNIIEKDLTKEIYAQEVKKWFDLGVKIVGGCCGIGSEYIKYLSEKIFLRKKDL